MVEKQKDLILRVEKLLTYMNYEWQSDKDYLEYIKDFKVSTASDAGSEKDQMEMVKRNYYSTYLDKTFEKAFEFENEEERKNYFAYCQFYGSLGALSEFQNTKNDQEPVLKSRLRQILYLLFILVLPLSKPWYVLPLLQLSAIMVSISQRHDGISALLNKWAKLFMEEEPMNLALIIMMLFCGQMLRYVFNGCLSLYAFVDICIWCQQILNQNPETAGLALLKPVIKFGDLYRVEIIKVKNHIEVLVGLSSIPLMLMGKVAPIFPVFYWQYLRVKYVTNQFTRHSFLEFDNKILKKVFVGQFYTIIIGNLKKVVFYFINYKQEEGAIEQNQEQLSQDDLGVGKKKQSKKLD